MKQLRNFTEAQVEGYLDQWLSKMNVCQCDDCKLDIMAIMLNKLPPHYVATERGALFAQMKEFEIQHRVDFMYEMNEAIRVVNENPRHV